MRENSSKRQKPLSYIHCYYYFAEKAILIKLSKAAYFGQANPEVGPVCLSPVLITLNRAVVPI